MSTKRPMNYGGSEELEHQIEDLIKALEITNFCHGCVHNSESSTEIIDILNKSADIINIEDNNRWWNI